MVRVPALSSRGPGAGSGRPACGADGSARAVSTMLAVFSQPPGILCRFSFINVLKEEASGPRADRQTATAGKLGLCGALPNQIMFL